MRKAADRYGHAKGVSNLELFSCVPAFPERSLLSNPSRIVGPVQQRLALPATAIQIARFTVLFQLRHVAANGAPTRQSDVSHPGCGARNNIGNTIGTSRADLHGCSQPLTSPYRNGWLGIVYAVIVERRIAPATRREPRALEPARRKFFPVSVMYFPPNTPNPSIFRPQFRPESGTKSRPIGFVRK